MNEKKIVVIDGPAWIGTRSRICHHGNGEAQRLQLWLEDNGIKSQILSLEAWNTLGIMSPDEDR